MHVLGIDCSWYLHEEGFAPGLLCSTFPESGSEDHVIISAHIDSRGTFGNLRAPGADDDGSGSAHLLAIARAISKHNVTFEHPVTLAFFTGEEQGLVMSNHFAHTLKKENISVQLNIQADMLGYRVPGEPLQLALPATIDLPEASFLVANISQLYAPELVVGRTAACCSDHQSFLQLGFPATQVFERNGWIADPMYHNSGDLADREGYDAEQIKSIAKVTMATLFEVAGWKQAN
jgi:Zn-dependent M28 family amino/carboxypeptidase